MNSPTLAAVLIVRNEAELLPACLASLTRIVDRIHVHDTGSTDGTPELAAAHPGTTVTEGTWSDDFAAARNTAAAGCAADWILAVDADHRATGDPAALRALLARAETDALLVEVDDAHHADPYRQTETRLYRPAALEWAGRVHERLIGPGADERTTVPSPVLTLRHIGHATYERRTARAERNLALTLRTLDETSGDDRAQLAATLLALGRDCAAAERWQRAVDTFETLRELFPGTPEWLRATDGLARVVLAAGYDKVCLVLVEELRAAGAPPAYCDWLAAQAIAQLGDPQEAARLLAGVTEVVDTAGRRRGQAALQELNSLVGRLTQLVKI